MTLGITWLWYKRPGGRAAEIEAAKRVEPRNLTNRDKAYVLELYERFGSDPFELWRFKNIYLAKRVAKRFGIKAGRVDHAGMIGNRLRGHGFLNVLRPGKYQLTDKAVELAIDLASPPRFEEPEKPNG